MLQVLNSVISKPLEIGTITCVHFEEEKISQRYQTQYHKRWLLIFTQVVCINLIHPYQYFFNSSSTGIDLCS